MDMTFLLRFIEIWALFALITILFSLLVCISSFNIFKKAGKNTKNSFIPVYNLIILFDITELPRTLFPMMFCPIINLLMILILLYRLSIVYQTSLPFAIGLIFLSIIFLPILNFSKYVKIEEKQIDDVSSEMIPLLTEKQYAELNNIVEEIPVVDNVFKAPHTDEPPAPTFKANPNQIKYMEMVMPEEKVEEIKRVEPVKVEDLTPNKFINTGISEEDETIEIVEL